MWKKAKELLSKQAEEKGEQMECFVMEKKTPAAANQPKSEAQSFRELMQALEAELRRLPEAATRCIVS